MDSHLRMYCPPGYTDSNSGNIDGAWRATTDHAGLMTRISKLGTNMSTRVARVMRDNLMFYFMGGGEVEWQYERAGINIE